MQSMQPTCGSRPSYKGGGGGGGHPDPEIDKGGQSPKKNIKSIGPLKQKKAHGRIALKRAALLLK